MLTRQEWRTQKKLLAQRNGARTEVEALSAEVERLKGDVRVLAAEEIRKVEREFHEQLAAAHNERDKAIAERDALLKNFEGAIAEKLDATKKELTLVTARLHAAQGDVLRGVTQIAVITAKLDEATIQWNAGDKTIERLKEELGTLKMEDTKQLRKRLQAKTERCEALERENEQLKKAPRPQVVPTSQIALQNLLSNSLRRRLKEDAPSSETAAPAAPAETPSQP